MTLGFCPERCTRPDCQGRCDKTPDGHEQHEHRSPRDTGPGDAMVTHVWQVHLCLDCWGPITGEHPGSSPTGGVRDDYRHRDALVCVRSLGARLGSAETQMARMRAVAHDHAEAERVGQQFHG